MPPTRAAEDLEALIARIPKGCPSTTPTIQCCCGHTDCAYLKHNGSALEDLEKNVHTAAQLGQALLVRHEAYMVDAERDRLEMSHKIEQLEMDKKELEAENARTIEENRGLLDELEGLNTTVFESEAHIKALEATLQSTHHEIRRLEELASRTHSLEMQLMALEQEQDLLQRTIVTTEAEERSAIQRWKRAERHLTDLQDQLEKIEREAREERERHVEVLGRMERQRAVERELDTAAGRLKGAAALTTNGRNGTNVVSHFVKDILQDNANLQLGIVELREMLMSSNDEVQSLREQLLQHQPMGRDANDAAPTLKADLASKDGSDDRVVSQALHIHHHYHVPKEETRKPRKKRAPIHTSIFTPPRHLSPRTPGRAQDSASAILSQTSVTIPAPITPTNRWSMQSGQMSEFAPSSVPSSPQSMYRHSALFDRGLDLDSSRPTSPGSSVDPMSPQFAPFRHRKRASEVSNRSFAGPVNFQPHNVIHEEDGDVEEIQDLETPSVPSLDDDTNPSDESNESNFTEHEWSTSFQPVLRRSTSHESILSISGIDIHTLQSRPSQLRVTGHGLYPRSSKLSVPASPLSIDTLTSSSMITAHPVLSRQGHSSSSYLRSSMGVNYNSDNRSIKSNNSGLINSAASEGGLGSKVGGWVFGHWGVSPAKSSGSLNSNASSTQSPRVVSTPADPLRAFMGRPPGINQKGPIPGFTKSTAKPPSAVTPREVDTAALKEILREGGLG